MAIQIRPQFHPITPFIGAEVDGIDLREPLAPEQIAAIDDAMDRYAVLVFHDQPLTNDQHLAFTRSLGPIETSTGNKLRKPEDIRLPTTFADVSNLDKDGKIAARETKKRMAALANRLWHTDASFRVIPARYSILSGRLVPAEGPNTEFADMRAAYDALDAKTKAEIENLICEHSLIFSRGQLGFTEFLPDERVVMKPVRQRLVFTHPVTGRKSLFLASHIGGIVGWPRPEAMAFIRDLIEHATQEQFVYVHRWAQHDLVIWDNIAVQQLNRRSKKILR